MIRDLATDPKKRELFTCLAEHFKTLAAELERALLRQDDAFPGRETQPLPDGKGVQEGIHARSLRGYTVVNPRAAESYLRKCATGRNFGLSLFHLGTC